VELPSGVRAVPTRRVDLSATEIRERVAAGRSIRGFVPDAVAAYIAAHGLYQ
jgi:nicotinate-nucleotide adenylyltransferase